MPARRRLHQDRQHPRRHRRQPALLRTARAGRRALSLRAVGLESEERRQEGAQAANLLVHRVQLPRHDGRPAQPRLVPAHPGSHGQKRHHHLEDALRGDHQLLRVEREADWVRDRPRDLRRPLARPLQSRDGRNRQADQYPGPAREQHRLALPRPQPAARRGEGNRLHHGRDRRASPHRQGRRAFRQTQARGRLLRRPASRLERLPRPLHRRDARPGRQRHAQRVEPHPVPDHLVLVPLRIGVRDRHRPRHGHARLRAGHFGHGSQRCGPRARHARHALAPAVPGRPHLAPGAAAHR